MVFFNYSTMQMAAKVVYYGPGLCGKTTNLQYIYQHTNSDSRGEMVSLETETDRTLFFDLLPIDVGTIGGFNTRIQLYTVPGQVFYNTTRKLVLKGVDGVVFVADSQRPMLQANVESFKNLEENLAEIGLSSQELPLVIQYNKRDLKEICAIEELNETLNYHGWPHFEASAITGRGVYETLKGVSKLTLLALKKRLSKDPAERSSPSPVAPSRARVETPATEPVASHRASAAVQAAAVASAPPVSLADSLRGVGTPEFTSAPPEPALPTPPAGGAELPPPPANPQATPAQFVPRDLPSPPGPTPSSTRGPAAQINPGSSPSSPSRRAEVPAPAESTTATGARKQVDVLAELEKIRRQALGGRPTQQPPAAGAANQSFERESPNGKGEFHRDIQLKLTPTDFKRTRRFAVRLQVEDEDRRVVDEVSEQVEITNIDSLSKILLRLNVALNPEE